jgi:hypothetical protein
MLSSSTGFPEEVKIRVTGPSPQPTFVTVRVGLSYFYSRLLKFILKIASDIYNPSLFGR